MRKREREREILKLIYNEMIFSNDDDDDDVDDDNY